MREKSLFLRSLILVIAILTVTSMSAGSLGQVPPNLGNAAVTPPSPPNPYPVFGIVEQMGSHTPVNGANVWVNDSNNAVSLTNVTNSQGKYQVNLPEYGVGDNITVTALWTTYEGTNWTAVTGVAPQQSWCNVTLGLIPLSTKMSAKPGTMFVGQQTTLSTVVTGGLGPYSFSWTFGDGSTSVPTGTNSTVHTYSKVGTFQANVSVTDSQLASAASSVDVSVLATPTLTLTFAPALPQVGTNVTFHPSLSVTGRGWIFFFVFGDGTNSGYLPFGVNPTHSYAVVQTYTANCTAYNISSRYRVDSSTVSVPVGPGIFVGLGVGPSPTEVGRDTLFTANSSRTNSAVEYEFTFGDGSPVAGPQLSPDAHHNYTSSGPVTASVVGTNQTGAKASASVSLTVLPHVSVGWITKPTSGIQPHYVAVQAAAAAGEGPYLYTITFSGQSYSTFFKNASGFANVTIDQAGTFTASVKVTDSLGLTAWGTNLTFNVTYVATLTASISGPYSGYTGVNLPFTLNLSGGEGPYTITWLFGDGTAAGPTSGVTALQVFTNHTFVNANTYVITAYVNDSLGHSAKAIWSVDVSSPPPPPPPALSITALTIVELILVFAVVAIVLGILIFFALKRRKKKDEEEKAKEAMSALKAGSGGAAAGTAASGGSSAPEQS
jgi:hypothetical protein